MIDFRSSRRNDPFITFQLQHLVQDESCVAVSDAYKEARGMMRSPVGTAVGGIALESVYQKKVEQALADENCFKVITVRMERGNHWLKGIHVRTMVDNSQQYRL